jgi:hypothetical protein
LNINPDLPKYSVADIQKITAYADKSDFLQKLSAGVLEGGRNNHLMRFGGSLLNRDITPEQMFEQLRNENLANCLPPLEDSEVLAIMRSLENYRGNEARAKNYTHQTVAEILIAKLKDKIRYNVERKAWLRYDGTRWNFNSPGGIRPLLRDTIQELYISAAKREPEARSAVHKQLKLLENSMTQRNILEMASTYPEVIVSQEQLDCDIYLLIPSCNQ